MLSKFYNISFHVLDASMHTGMPSGSDSPISAEFTPTSIQKGKALASLGLFFSTARKGYLYDMLNTPRLLTEYDFTEDCISACLSRKMLNVITKNGLETYTTRLYPSAAMASHMIFGEEVMASPHNQGKKMCFRNVVIVVRTIILTFAFSYISIKANHYYLHSTVLLIAGRDSWSSCSHSKRHFQQINH